MIDIHNKNDQYREAIATGQIKLKTETIRRIKDRQIEKGDPLQISALAGIQGAKLTPTIIPLCHSLLIESVNINFEISDTGIKAIAKVSSNGKTGVEMEALSAVTISLLNIWDVVKMYEKDNEGQYPSTEIYDIKVVKKVKR